jgi:hypothetical protein
VPPTSRFPPTSGPSFAKRGRVGPHPVAPHSVKLAARRIENESDVLDVIALMRLNYDRVIALTRAPVSR